MSGVRRRPHHRGDSGDTDNVAPQDSEGPPPVDEMEDGETGLRSGLAYRVVRVQKSWLVFAIAVWAHFLLPVVVERASTVLPIVASVASYPVWEVADGSFVVSDVLYCAMPLVVAGCFASILAAVTQDMVTTPHVLVLLCSLTMLAQGQGIWWVGQSFSRVHNDQYASAQDTASGPATYSALLHWTVHGYGGPLSTLGFALLVAVSIWSERAFVDAVWSRMQQAGADSTLGRMWSKETRIPFHVIHNVLYPGVLGYVMGAAAEFNGRTRLTNSLALAVVLAYLWLCCRSSLVGGKESRQYFRFLRGRCAFFAQVATFSMFTILFSVKQSLRTEPT